MKIGFGYVRLPARNDRVNAIVVEVILLIDDIDTAKELAEKKADELIKSLDADMLKEAKEMGMAASIFAPKIEEYRDLFNKEVCEEIAAMELFDNAVSNRINA